MEWARGPEGFRPGRERYRARRRRRAQWDLRRTADLATARRPVLATGCQCPGQKASRPQPAGMGSWPSAPESIRKVVVLPVRANGPHGPSVPQGWVTCSSRTTFDRNSCDNRDGGDDVVWLLVVSRITTCAIPAEFHTVYAR